MRHRVAAKHFNRDSNQRHLLFVGLVTSLVEHGHTTTTREKAREIKRIADKLIHKAQTDSVASRRDLHRFFGKRDVVNTLVERVAPAMKDRTSGFTRIEVVGLRRGDNSQMVKLSLVNQPETAGLKSGMTHKASKPKKAAAPKVAAKTTTKAAAKPAAKKVAKVAPKKTTAKKATKTKKEAKA